MQKITDWKPVISIIRATARKATLKQMADVEDCVSECLLRLVAQGGIPDGFNQNTYIHMIVKNTFVDLHRSKNGREGTAKSKAVHQSYENDSKMLCTNESCLDDMIKQENRQELKKLWDNLIGSANTKDSLTLRYGRDMLPKHIGPSFSKTNQQISDLMKFGIQKLKKSPKIAEMFSEKYH